MKIPSVLHYSLLCAPLLLAATACASWEPKIDAESQAIVEREFASISEAINLILEAQKSGLEHHDFEAYMSMWGPEARIVGCRMENEERFELASDRDQIAATRRIRFAGPPIEGLTLELGSFEIEIRYDNMRIQMPVTVRVGDDYERVMEVFKLRREDPRWIVVENLWWPVETYNSSRDQRVVFTPEYFAALDHSIDETASAGPSRSLADRYFAAYRFSEAYVTSVAVTELPGAGAADWVERGRYAVFAGEADDAWASFRRARELDPTIQLPFGDPGEV